MATPGHSLGNIYCICGGTRGDQQPVVMTAVKLQAIGYNIIMCIGSEGAAWCAELGFQHFALASFEAVVRENRDIRGAAEDNGDFKRFVAAVGAQVGESMSTELPLLWAKMNQDRHLKGLLCTSTHALVAEVVSRKLGVVSVAMFMTPMIPTQDYAPYFLDVKEPSSWQSIPNADGTLPGPFAKFETWPGGDLNIPLWESLLHQLSTDFLPAFNLVIKLMKADDLFPIKDEDKISILKSMFAPSRGDLKNGFCKPSSSTVYAYSDVLVGVGGPHDWTSNQRQLQCGYIFDACAAESVMSSWDEDLQNFIQVGSEPIYLGWGSMCRENNAELVRAAISACKVLGKRGIVLRGWAHLSLEMLDKGDDADLLAYAERNIFFVDKVNHLKLFPKCSCIVAHAGAGTAAAMFRSGKPCVITPVWWDQNFMGDRAEAMGCGIRGPHFSKLSGDNLAPLIEKVTSESRYSEKAKNVRDSILSQPCGDQVISNLMHQKIVEMRCTNGTANKFHGGA